MPVWKFIQLYKEKNPNGHFFDKDTLRFFGERISDMRVLKKTLEVTSSIGKVHTCYTLSVLQRKNPAGPLRKYHYFDVDTMQHIV